MDDMQPPRERGQAPGTPGLRRTLRRGASWLAVVSLIAVSAGSASAGTISIQFDISQSWVSMLGGTIVIPPDGNLVSDPMRIAVPGNSATDIQSGAAIVKKIGFDLLSIDKDILGEAHVTGSVKVGQIGDAQGNLVLSGGNGTLALPNTIASLGLNLAIDPNVLCSGAACSLIGSFPFTTPVVPILTGTLTIANISVPGSASFDQSFSLTFSGVTGILRLVGQEIQRTVVPEPSSAVLIGLGVLAAAAVGRSATHTRRRRARS